MQSQGTAHRQFVSQAIRSSGFSYHGSIGDTTLKINHADEASKDLRYSMRMPLKSQIKQRETVHRGSLNANEGDTSVGQHGQRGSS